VAKSEKLFIDGNFKIPISNSTFSLVNFLSKRTRLSSDGKFSFKHESIPNIGI